MPILSVMEADEGRSIALTVDSIAQLQFSEFAVPSGGKGFDAFMSAMVGWLMHDPRYEFARGELVGAHEGSRCLSGIECALKLYGVGRSNQIDVTFARFLERENKLAAASKPIVFKADTDPPWLVPVGHLDAGVYQVRVRVWNSNPSEGQRFETHFYAIAEQGGEEWARTSPDREKLAALAKAHAGTLTDAAHIDTWELHAEKVITLQKQIMPLFSAWIYSLIAAIGLGAHWILRRQASLT
jgi:hypothetical protein